MPSAATRLVKRWLPSFSRTTTEPMRRSLGKSLAEARDQQVEVAVAVEVGRLHVGRRADVLGDGQFRPGPRRELADPGDPVADRVARQDVGEAVAVEVDDLHVPRSCGRSSVAAGLADRPGWRRSRTAPPPAGWSRSLVARRLRRRAARRTPPRGRTAGRLPTPRPAVALNDRSRPRAGQPDIALDYTRPAGHRNTGPADDGASPPAAAPV